MWPKFYKDYEIDKPLIKYQVEPSHGIIGVEMHDLNGWGTTRHIPWGPVGQFPHLPKSPLKKK